MLVKEATGGLATSSARAVYTVSKIRKIFTGPMYKVLSNCVVFSYVYRSFIPNKATFTKFGLTQAVPTKFTGSGGHGKCNCAQDRANFHRSRAWQIVLLLTLLYIYYIFYIYRTGTWSDNILSTYHKETWVLFFYLRISNLNYIHLQVVLIQKPFMSFSVTHTILV